MINARRLLVSRAPLLLAGLSGATMVGCGTTQGQYDQALDTIRSLESRNAELQSDLQQQEALIANMRGNASGADAAAGDLRSENQRLRSELQGALRQIEDFERQLSNISMGGLDRQTDAALSELARRYPDLISYDSARGMLRFASDFTFGSGSAELSAQAEQGLTALADVLKTPAAQAYDTIVVGHTDSQRPGANTRQRFGSNRGLSVARSISVVNALGSRGVPGAKMQAAGWGEYRPQVPNTASGNTPANRRVEIFLVPTTADIILQGGSTEGGNAGGVGIDRQGPAGVRIEPTK